MKIYEVVKHNRYEGRYEEGWLYINKENAEKVVEAITKEWENAKYPAPVYDKAYIKERETED